MPTQTSRTHEVDLSVQPMVHVARLDTAIAFYELLGGRLIYGSRDGDWALIGFAGGALSLLARPGGPDNPEPVELQFVTRGKLEPIAARVEAGGAVIAQPVTDEAFGRMLQLRTPDGLLIKLLELDRDLID